MSDPNVANGLPGNTWRRYLTDYNEGLGLVYERFVLNDFLDALRRRYAIASVLEAPLYGMAGVSGINSAILAQQGAQVTLIDDTPERLDGVRRIWRKISSPEVSGIMISRITTSGFSSIIMARAGALLVDFKTRKPLTRIISAKRSAASGSSSMIRTVRGVNAIE